MLDDHPLVNGNPFIKESQSLLSYFSQEDGVSPDEGTGDYHSGYYRPLINVSYFINYKMFGMRPGGFRAANLVFHVMTCLVLFMVMARFTRGLVPLAATLLFGLHPANTEAVAWISARNNLLVGFFSLASFYFYAFSKPDKRKRGVGLSVLFYILALLCKEFAFMLLPILFLYDLTLGGKTFRHRSAWTGYIPYIAASACYLLVRWAVTESVLSPAEPGDSAFHRIYFIPYLIVFYVRLVVLPFGVHSFIMTYPQEFFCWEAAIGFAGLFLMGVLVWRHRKEKMILFPVFAFLMGLFPVLNIIPTSAVSIVSMRWLYFPLLFLMAAIGWAMERLLLWKKAFGMVLVFAGAAYLGAYSYFLNSEQWRDDWSLCHREVTQFNNLFYAGCLAEQYHKRKDYEKAETYYRLAIANYPRIADDRINYAALLVHLEKPREALMHLDRAKTLKMIASERGRFYNNQGMAYFQLGRLDEAMRSFEEAVRVCPAEATFRANLGAAYGNKGQYEDSIKVLTKGLETAPTSLELRKNLSVIYIRMGAYDKALSTLEEISPSERAKSKEVETLLKGLQEKRLQTSQ
jgi:tetratricopeptide (TPR) repeat protein